MKKNQEEQQKTQEEQFRQLTDQVLGLAWKITEEKEPLSLGPLRTPLEVARNESIMALRCTAKALLAVLKLVPSPCGGTYVL